MWGWVGGSVCGCGCGDIRPVSLIVKRGKVISYIRPDISTNPLTLNHKVCVPLSKAKWWPDTL